MPKKGIKRVTEEEKRAGEDRIPPLSEKWGAWGVLQDVGEEATIKITPWGKGSFDEG